MCCCKQLRRAIVVGLLAVGGSPALAQETGSEESFRPWAIGLTLQTDEAQSESFYTTVNWGVAENTWLFFAAGQSKSPVGRADIKTKDLSAGIDHNFGLLGASFEVEQWGSCYRYFPS